MSIQRVELSLQQARLTGTPGDVFNALILLAHLHFRQGRYPQTQSLVDEVLRDAPIDACARCDALRILGNCAAELGDPDAAEVYYHQAIDLARQLNYRYALYKCLHSLATNIYWPRGQFDLTLAAGKEALTQAMALNLGEELWFPLADIAWVYWSTGQRHLASEIADQMECVVAPGSLGDGFTCCLRAGLVEPGPDFLETVLELYQHARSIAETTGDPGLNVEVRLGLCRAYRTEKDFPTAAMWADDAVAVTVRMNYRQFQAAAAIERARTAMAAGNHVSALADLQLAIELATQLRANFDLARAYLLLAALLQPARPSTSPQRGFAQDARAAWLEAMSRIISGGYAFLLEQERAIAFPLLAHYLTDKTPEVSTVSATLLNHLSRVPPPALDIVTLGKFEVSQRGQMIEKSVWHQRKAGELFRLLLISRGHSLTRDEIIETVWPDKSIAQAQPLFHRATSQLRRVLEPDLPDKFPSRYLEVDEGRVTLHVPTGSSLDFEEIEQCVCNEQWSEALALYGGDLFPDDRYAEWAAAPRERYAQLYLRVLIVQAQLDFNAHAYASTLDRCRRALAIEPWHEAAALLAMRAYLAQNDRPNALRLYRTLERTLRDELGLAPMPELQASISFSDKVTG